MGRITKGIILAGGSGSRLDPLTRVACKQLLPLYDKPMIYYPLATLMLGGLRDILIITTPHDEPAFVRLLGDGSRLGLSLSYAVQPQPEGLAQAFVIGSEFLNGQGAALILGDNIFYGKLDFFRSALRQDRGATIFACPTREPERFAVVEFDATGRVLSLEEKPAQPRSRYAVPGLYVYDETVTERARALPRSPRGEYEITDLNLSYLRDGQLRVEPLGRGIAWLDTGTPASLLEAGNYIATLERQQHQKIACLEEIAFQRGLIDATTLQQHIANQRNPEYRLYLEMVLAEGPPVYPLSSSASEPKT